MSDVVYHFTCAARTDIGIVRSGNEDNYLMLADRGIFIVADGMGGHAAGEVASEMAVRITSHKIGSVRGLSDEQAAAFWERMAELVAEFDRLPRSGDTVYGFAIGVYPTDFPTLPSSEG